MANPRNDRNQAVTKFCLAMEEHRRTEPGRVRTAKEFVAIFFPHDEQRAPKNRLFVLMPNDVRGPVVSKWGIRGTKAALQRRRREGPARRPRRARRRRHRRGHLRRGRDARDSHRLDRPVATGGASGGSGKLTGRRDPEGARHRARARPHRRPLVFPQRPGPRRKAQRHRRRLRYAERRIASSRGCASSTSRETARRPGSSRRSGGRRSSRKTAQDALLFALDAFAKKVGLVARAAEGGGRARVARRPRCPPTGPSSAQRRDARRAVRDAGPSIPDAPARFEEGADEPAASSDRAARGRRRRARRARSSSRRARR